MSSEQERHKLMKQAQEEAKAMGNDYVGSEHVLLALLHQNQTWLSRQLAKEGVYYFQLRDDVAILFGMKERQKQTMQITQIVHTLFAQCDALYEKRQETCAYADCMGEVLTRHPSSVAMELLKRYDVALPKPKGNGGIAELDAIDALRCLNHTQAPRLLHRERELQLLVEILLRKEKANPLLLGEPGVGKSALVEYLAAQIEQGNIPLLQNHYIYELDLNALVAGTRYRGDFEEKIRDLIAAFRAHPNAIIFIDEIHQMIGAGRSEGSIDVASVFKPCLARRELRCIGATTIEEYENGLEKDKALQRRFQTIVLREPDVAGTIAILKERCEEYGRYHDVEVSEELMAPLVRISDYYLPGGHFPDKAIDVLDLSCARARSRREETLSETCVREVVEEIGRIPCDGTLRMERCLRALEEERLDASLLRQVKGELRQLAAERLEQPVLRCWGLWAKREANALSFLRVISREFFNQPAVIEWDMSLFAIQQQEVLRRLHRDPFGILCIRSLSQAPKEQLSMMLHALHSGELCMGEWRVKLRHTLVVLYEEEEADLQQLAQSQVLDAGICLRQAQPVRLLA